MINSLICFLEGSLCCTNMANGLLKSAQCIKWRVNSHIVQLIVCGIQKVIPTTDSSHKHGCAVIHILVGI